LDSGKGILGDKLLPGGMLYFKIDDPLIRLTGEADEEDIERAIMKKLKMDGLVLADVNLVREMDRDIDGASHIVPARINKNGKLGKSSAASMDQFDSLCSYSRDLLIRMGQEIMEGNAYINPYRYKKMTACRYCPYSSVCQFDPSFQDNRYRLIKDMKEEEVWSNMGDGRDDSGQ
ncbi:MAG TPA: PD-(D/E)XK nuclease family protein, partial [Clostridia bacterium]|nr:PD-(D/E)XK nuclease family protein [Clostridia bacterium]